MKIELPETPIEGYEIRWFRAGDRAIAEECAIYHANRAWDEIYPEAKEQGAPFCDEWRMVRDGKFSGRYLMWLAPLHWDFSRVFATRKEAISALRLKFSRRIDILKRDLVDCEKQLAALAAEESTS